MVSIIVPVYNVEEYLPVCVKSLQGQTARDIRILLVDDGATDGSGELCDRYAARDDRIRVIHKENGGISSARNAGLDQAEGEWVLFLDGDDYLAATAVERLLAVVADHPDADFVQFHYQETYDDGWSPDPRIQANPRIVTDTKNFFDTLYAQGGIGASACTKLFRRTLVDGLRFTQGLRHEDEELMTRLLPLCRKVVYTDLVLYGYRMRPGSTVHSGFHPRSMDALTVMSQRLQTLSVLGYQELVGLTRQRMFQTAAWQYCLARRGGFREETAQLKKWLLTLSREEVPHLSGQYKLLHRLTRLTSAAPGMYYCVRRLCGKS